MPNTIRCLSSMCFLLFAVFNERAFAQADFWKQTSGPSGGVVYSLAANSSGHLFAGAAKGLYRSSDNGAHWSLAGIGIGNRNIYFNCISVDSKDDIYVGTSAGAYRSTDDGDTWSALDLGLSKFDIFAVASDSRGHIYLATADSGIFRSSNSGSTWVPSRQNRTYARSLAIDSAGVVYAGVSGGVLRSTDYGNTWVVSLSIDTPVFDLFLRSTDDLFVGSSRSDYSSNYGLVFRSTDQGTSWTKVQNGIVGYLVSDIAAAPNGDLFAATCREDPSLVGGGIYRSTNNGDTWTSTALTGVEAYSALVTAQGEVFAGTNAGILRSTDNGASWITSHVNIFATEVTALTIGSGGNVIAGTWGGGLFSTSDKGTTWQEFGLTNYYVESITARTTGNIYVSTYGQGFQRSSDGGKSWSTSGSWFNLTAFVFCANGTIVGTFQSGIVYSTDDGETWTWVNLAGIRCLLVHLSGVLYAGSQTQGVLRSTDNGLTWTQFALSNTSVAALAINSKGVMFVAAYAGPTSMVFRSTDEGGSWNEVGSGLDVNRFAINSLDHIFATGSSGVYRSTDEGISWTQINSGLTETNIRSLVLDSEGFLYVGSSSSGAFRSVQSTTSVPISLVKLPSSFSLAQNYPNPFNPSTTIRFDVPQGSHIRLEIFNVLGERVAILVNEDRQASSYAEQFNASQLTSGVYFYRIQAGMYLETKKLVLMK